MEKKLFVVKYTGAFGFIKPWTAVRDSETFSQQFLTPSIVEGIEKKLFSELLNTEGIQKIVAHRLSYAQITNQQEVIQTRGWNSKRRGKEFEFDRPKAIINRGLLQNPILHLAFTDEVNAQKAFTQHICLCRNEDLVYPTDIIETNYKAFEEDEEQFFGYELVFEENKKSFLVGYHRSTGQPMYGWLKVIGNPVKSF
ncbi:MAG: hypothetical protein V3U92_15995 [Cellulophaga sp.]